MEEKNRIREHQINIRLTNLEYENVKKKAEYCNITISDFIRKQIADGIIIKYESIDIKKLTYELNKIGVNINQIAHHINGKGGEYDKKDIRDLRNEFEKLQTIVYEKVWGI